MWKVQLKSSKEHCASDVERLENAIFPECVAVTWQEQREIQQNQDWLIEALYADEPDAADLAPLLSASDASDIQIEKVPDVDWVAENQRTFQPLRVGRFLVADHQHMNEIGSGETLILVDAGAAFGTGHHGTTLGCLEALVALAKLDRPNRILDLGTGSGILAIASAKLWRAPVLATDLDPVAVCVATENARVNDVASLIRTARANGFRHRVIMQSAPFDLIVANILARPLCQLAAAFPRHLSSRGQVILSGLVIDQEPMVLSAFRSAGLFLDSRIRSEEWSTLILSRTRH